MEEKNITLIKQAWQVKTKRGKEIAFFIPGAKRYSNQFYTNSQESFVNISVTASACSCKCDHCGGKLLQTMIPATTSPQLMRVADNLYQMGSKGLLISGGANLKGQVPLLSMIDGIKYAKDLGLKVVVHTGLLNEETAKALKKAGVDRVLIDVIADESTIKSVYHLDMVPEDYALALQIAKDAELALAPHIVIGLHYGKIKGEYRALEMIKGVEPHALVLVVLTPQANTVMENVELPDISQVTDILAHTRIKFPHIPVNLGCARPYGLYKRELEKMAVDCGLDGIAYPDESTFPYVGEKGLTFTISEECCSLI